MLANFAFPTAVRFGPGVRREIPEALGREGHQRPLLIMDPALPSLPAFAELIEALVGCGITPRVFSGFAGNPSEGHVTAGVAAYRAHGADAILAIGGGAALDIGKAVALMVGHPGSILDYEDGKPDARPVEDMIPFVITVPTTAGTGSEVGRSTVIADGAHRKRVIFSPRLMPRLVFADPELLLGLPAKITAATGMDALTHCVEAYLARGYHPLCDGVALQGLRIAREALPRSVVNGADLVARSDMMMAALMGAVAFQKGLGVAHSCAHALSQICAMHHGLANGIIIPFAMEFNARAVPERFYELAAAAGLGERTGAAFVSWLRDLQARVGVPPSLRAAGVGPERLDALVAAAVADGCHQSNPVPCNEGAVRGIFEAALT